MCFYLKFGFEFKKNVFVTVGGDVVCMCVLYVADVIDDDDDDLVDDNLENAINNALGASTNYNSPYSTLEGGPCRP